MVRSLYLDEFEEILKLMEKQKDYNPIIWATYMKIIPVYNQLKKDNYNSLLILKNKKSKENT